MVVLLVWGRIESLTDGIGDLLKHFGAIGWFSIAVAQHHGRFGVG